MDIYHEYSSGNQWYHGDHSILQSYGLAENKKRIIYPNQARISAVAITAQTIPLSRYSRSRQKDRKLQHR